MSKVEIRYIPTSLMSNPEFVTAGAISRASRLLVDQDQALSVDEVNQKIKRSLENKTLVDIVEEIEQKEEVLVAG